LHIIQSLYMSRTAMNLFMIILMFFSLSGCVNQNPWRNEAGLDPEGYDKQGFKEGFDRQGFDIKGCNAQKYDRLGNACDDIAKIRQKNLNYGHFKTAQSDVAHLKTSMATQAQALSQAQSDLISLQTKFMQQTQEALSWQQKYAAENSLVKQKDADLSLTKATLITKNQELHQAQKDLKDAQLEIHKLLDHENTQRIDTLDLEKKLNNKLDKAQEIVKAVQDFISSKVASIKDLVEANLVYGTEGKPAKNAQALVRQLDNLLKQALLSSNKNQEPEKTTNVLLKKNPHLTIPETPSKKPKKKEKNNADPNLTIPSTPQAIIIDPS